MQITPSVRFSGDTPVLKRIKQFKKAEAKASVPQPPQSVKKPSRRERLAQIQKADQDARLASAATYQAALEQYLTDPKPVHDFLASPVYTDQDGNFTGQDLLQALRAEEKWHRRTGIGIMGFATAFVIPVVAVYLWIRAERGHVNLYNLEGTGIPGFLDRFPQSVQGQIEKALDKMDDLGLTSRKIEVTRAPMYLITDLGKRLLKHQ